MTHDVRELVMFDYDGVIVDSFDIFSAAFVDACRVVGIQGFTQQEDLLPVMEDNFYASMRARGVPDEQVAEVLQRLGAALVRARHWLKPFPLVSQVLEELAEARTVVIVTSSPPPLRLAASIVPRCAASARRAIARPRPWPAALPLPRWKGSKIASR